MWRYISLKISEIPQLLGFVRTYGKVFLKSEARKYHTCRRSGRGNVGGLLEEYKWLEDFRATKDIDLVLILEAMTPDFEI
jgi:hypothetical protein